MAAAQALSADLTGSALKRIIFENDVPSDIAISQSVEPFHISKVAAAAGIVDDELEPYGSHKAKVSADLVCRLFVEACHRGRACSNLLHHRSSLMFWND